MKYELVESGYFYKVIECESIQEAMDIAIKNVSRENYDWEDGEGCAFVDVSVHELDDKGKRNGIFDKDVIVLQPREPECVDDSGHNWQNPLSIVGGHAENPGVFAHGAGMLILHCCMKCGAQKKVNTWATRPDTGEQGMVSIHYKKNFYFIESLNK
jgi:hypothetical protein